jgi:aspartyl protease family protein
MAVSSGLRNALGEGASWLCAAAILFGGVVYHNELRGYAYAFVGLEMPADADISQTSQRPAGISRGGDVDARIRQAEARAAEAEARARKAEANARGHEAAAVRSQSESGRSRPQYGNIAELKSSRDGHVYAKAELNGSPIGVLVDTGATMVALTFEDAQRAGINVSNADFTGITQTANGKARFAPVTIDRITIGNITVNNVRGAVAEPGRMTVTLLGMSFLSKLIRFEMRNGTLVLEN